MRRAVFCLLILAAGCEPELGDCDQATAIRVAYDQASGMPAYEGQALMIGSCGYGSFCHGATPSDAFGVPEGLTFDVQLASVDSTVDELQVARLRRGRFRTVQEGRLILHTIDLGTMPPPDGNEVLAAAPVYVSPDMGDFMPLPEAGSDEGREILRNWLACAAPVVERPVPRNDGVSAVVVPPLDLNPIEPTWTSVFNDLLRGRGCAGARCHGGTDAGFQVTEMAQTHGALVGQTPRSDECRGGGTLVVAGDPGASLLIEKLRADPSCGDRMPLSGIPIAADDIAAVEMWIMNGAAMD